MAVIMMLPDINPLLRRFNGKIGLRGLYHILFHKNEVKGVRGVLFGVKKPYQKLGLPVVAFDHMNKVIQSSKQYEYVEYGWTLEDNDSVNQFIIETGAAVRNRYRIYRRSMNQAGDSN